MEYFEKQFLKVVKLMFFTLLLILSSTCCKVDDCKCNHDCPELSVDFTEFFIAHAGGAIDGMNYTNSLEALNLSYSKGCKLFELDLQLSTDGKMIASHLPVDCAEAEFMSQLIDGKYTPMNMKSINDWFREHPKAILVTDKINNPQRIYDEFQFHDRVIMELFTWEAVDKANALGIKPMISETVMFGWSAKDIEMGKIPMNFFDRYDFSKIEKTMEEKKIEYICMSRIYFIDGNEKTFKQWKENGKKLYLYHLEASIPVSGISAEEYVWYYETNFCYGMYANNFDLLASLINEQR